MHACTGRCWPAVRRTLAASGQNKTPMAESRAEEAQGKASQLDWGGPVRPLNRGKETTMSRYGKLIQDIPCPKTNFQLVFFFFFLFSFDTCTVLTYLQQIYTRIHT